jgi:hypothetical protein
MGLAVAFFDLQIGHQQQVHNVHGIIRLKNYDSPPTGRNRQKFAMLHANSSAIRQMHDEFLERFGLPELMHSFGRHSHYSIVA